MSRLLVVGPVEGAYPLFVEVLQKAKFVPGDTIIQLGNFFGKYGYFRDISQFVTETNTRDIIALKGMNEVMILDAVEQWATNGRIVEEQEYLLSQFEAYIVSCIIKGSLQHEDVRRESIDFVQLYETYLASHSYINKHLFVFSGFDHTKSLDDQEGGVDFIYSDKMFLTSLNAYKQRENDDGIIDIVTESKDPLQHVFYGRNSPSIDSALSDLTDDDGIAYLGDIVMMNTLGYSEYGHLTLLDLSNWKTHTSTTVKDHPELYKIFKQNNK